MMGLRCISRAYRPAITLMRVSEFYPSRHFFGFQVVNALLLNFILRDAKSLVKHLLVADVTKRYGCLRNGANDIKNHRWFKNLDWFKLGQKRLPVPFIP